MAGDRMRRVDEAMREVLSGAITSEIKDPRVGFVTVTAVETSPDLRHARVFVSVLGTDAERKETFEGLASIASHLKIRVGRALRLRVAPDIEFKADDSIARAARIETLLAQIKDGNLPAEESSD